MHKQLLALLASFTITALVTTIGCEMGRSHQVDRILHEPEPLPVAVDAAPPAPEAPPELIARSE